MVARQSAAAFLVVAACFTATPARGVPCDPAAPRCPHAQACVLQGGEYVCTTGAPDPQDPTPDAAAVADSDDDGVPDATDNCPAIANAPQTNYDRDRFGDVCDPCPPVANDAPADSDSDGVADACDPEPATTGDRIFVFDAFANGASGWLATGPWSAATDGIAVDLAGGATATLERSVPAASRVVVSAAFTPTELRPLNVYAGMGVTTNTSYCALARTAFGEGVALIRTTTETLLESANAPFDLNTPHVTTLDARNRYLCRGDAISIEDNDATAIAEVGLRARGVRGTFHWVLVVVAP